MSFLGIQASLYELAVVVLDVTLLGIAQKLVAVFHLLNKRVERSHHLARVGDDALFATCHAGEIVVVELRIEAELHHLGIDEHKLQLCRVLLVEQ